MLPSVTIITTCMGRADHLRISLPLMLNQDYPNCSVLVVDWSSPDDLQSYLQSIYNPRLAWTKVTKKRFFSLTGARNAGGDYLINRFIEPKFLAFIDADVLLPHNFLKNNLSNIAENVYLQRNKTQKGDLGIWGSCICPTKAWREIRYNENIDTYGEEDNEFYLMLKASGYQHKTLNTEGIDILEHSDELRMQFYKETPDQIPELKKANKAKFRIQE